MAGRKQEYGSHVEEICEKNQPHFLTMYNCNALNVNVKRTRVLLVYKKREMFESRISATATEKLAAWEKPHAKTVAGPYDKEGHVERYCELANIKTEQLYTDSTHCLVDHNFKKEELETVGELSNCTWLESVDLTFFGP